jgi:hypothetical protein
LKIDHFEDAFGLSKFFDELMTILSQALSLLTLACHRFVIVSSFLFFTSFYFSSFFRYLKAVFFFASGRSSKDPETIYPITRPSNDNSL